MKFFNWIGNIIKNGIRITIFSTGKMFDPTDQVRTDPIADIINGKDGSSMDKKLGGWRDLSQWLYDHWGHDIQHEADVINGWQFSPELQVLVDSTWKTLSPDIQKALSNFVYEIYTKYGEAIAQKIFGNTMSQLQDTTPPKPAA